MLRFEKMTVKAQEAVQAAQEVAASHENQQIEPIHLLAALVAQDGGVVPPLVTKLGIRPVVPGDRARNRAPPESTRLRTTAHGPGGKPRVGTRF